MCPGCLHLAIRLEPGVHQEGPMVCVRVQRSCGSSSSRLGEGALGASQSLPPPPLWLSSPPLRQSSWAEAWPGQSALPGVGAAATAPAASASPPGYFQDNILCHFCASMISGLVTTAASMPVDIAKTRWGSWGISPRGVCYEVGRG